MVSFVQQTEGVRPAGIGDQRIVQRDLSYLDTLGRGINQAGQAVDQLGTTFANAKARELVVGAQDSLDADLAEVDRAERQAIEAVEGLPEDAGSLEIRSQIAKMERAAKQGRITRESARVRVADLVTKGIEASPIFADKIRRSATNLLGFNPQSEAVRQYFGAFETAEEQERRLRGERVNPIIQRAQDLSEAGGGGVSTQELARLIARNDVLDMEAEIASNEYNAGLRSTEEWMNTLISRDRTRAAQQIFRQLKEMRDQGIEINENTLKPLVEQQRQTSISTIITSGQAAQAGSGRVLPDDFSNVVSQRVSPVYQEISDYISSIDTNKLDAKALERLSVAQRVYGAQTFPQLTASNEIFGDRLTGKFIDIYQAAGGNEQELENLLTISPGLRPISELLRQDRTALPRLMQNTVGKLTGGVEGPLDTNDIAMLNLIEAQSSGDDVPPEDKEKVAQLFNDAGLPNRAASVILKARNSLATPAQKGIVKDNWDTLKNVTIPQLTQTLFQDPDVGYRVEVDDDGKLVLNAVGTNRFGQFSRPSTNSNYTDTVDVINMYLQSTNKGWGSDLNIADPKGEANKIARAINEGIRNLSVAQDAARVARTQAEAEERSRDFLQRTEAEISTEQPLESLQDRETEALQAISDSLRATP